MYQIIGTLGAIHQRNEHASVEARALLQKWLLISESIGKCTVKL